MEIPQKESWKLSGVGSDIIGLKSKIRNIKDYAINSMIYNTYYDEKIDEKLVYLESRDGLDFTGNIFRIVEELSTGKYGDLKIFIHAKPHVHDKIRSLQENYDLKIDKIIAKEAIATKVLEKAKYIITDSGIRPKYVKREGQIFLNTWHGTPLKVMGWDNTPEEHRLGNVQHPFLASDYLLYHNDYMFDKMIHAYMLEKIYPGKILLEGYPRNSVFFNKSRRMGLKDKLGLKDNEIFIYMPTFRGVLMNRNEEGQKEDVENYLKHIDDSLNDNQVLFAKLHVLNASKLNFSEFNHIREFPKGYELYDVINLADVLITDYSSVFFDFANTGRKIILFNYDEKEYESYRGFYFSLSDLPFPKVQTIDDLIKELNLPKNYDDSEFIEKFCTYDNPNAVENICKCVFNEEDSCRFETIGNDNPNILIYAGDLSNNEKTSGMLDFLNNMNRKKFNFFITYKQWDENILENHEVVLNSLPSDVEILPMRFNLIPTIDEKLKYDKFLSNRESSTVVDRLLKRSFLHQYSNFKFDLLLDFDKHDDYISLVFSNIINENKNDFEEFKKLNDILI